MTTELQVTMLGYRATGKTCYLLATTHEMQRGRGDFALEALNINHAYDLEARWAALVSTPHQWPLGDYRFTSYDFRLSYGLDAVTTFTWVDHQGGHVTWLNQDDLESRDELINQLARSHCIFLCLPGDIIRDFRTQPEQLLERLQMSSLRRILEEANLQKTAGQPFSVAVLITMADCLEDDLEGALNYVINQVRWLQPSPSLIQGSQHVVGFFPVRLGDDLRDKNAAIEPSDIAGPILFAAWAQERQRIAAAHAGLATVDPDREADALSRLRVLGNSLTKYPILVEGSFLTEKQKLEPPAPRIFVSHSSEDINYCKPLVEALEASGADVWYDRNNLGARRLWETIVNELNTRSTTILVLSKAAFNSPYVLEEFSKAYAFGNYRPRGPRTIVAVTASSYTEEELNRCSFLKDMPLIEQSGHMPWPVDVAVAKMLENLGISLPPITAQSSDSAQYLVTAGNNLVALGWYGNAISLFERALELEPTNITALTSSAYVYLVSGDLEKSLIASRQACAADQRNPRAWALMGASYYGYGANFLEQAKWCIHQEHWNTKPVAARAFRP